MFSEIPKDEEFLEAVISAMRSLLLMIASKNISQVQNVHQLQPFFFFFKHFLENLRGSAMIQFRTWMVTST